MVCDAPTMSFDAFHEALMAGSQPGVVIEETLHAEVVSGYMGVLNALPPPTDLQAETIVVYVHPSSPNFLLVFMRGPCVVAQTELPRGLHSAIKNKVISR